MSTPFKPSQELTFSTVEEDRKRLLKFFKELKSSYLIIDLSEVALCDSAGLAFLIEAKRLAKTYKKHCEFRDLNQHIQALATFCGVSSLLSSSEDLSRVANVNK